MPEFSRAMDVSVFALRPWVRRYDGTPVDPALHIMTHWLRLVLASVLVPLAGCVVAPYPTAYPSTVSTSASVDRIWDAALGAAADAGIQISNADRGTGRITGSKAGAAVTIELSPQADGS